MLAETEDLLAFRFRHRFAKLAWRHQRPDFFFQEPGKAFGLLTDGRTELTGDDIEAAFREFIPSAQGLEKEMQELAAVLECTQLSFLPQQWRDRISQPDGRAAIQERFVALKQLLKE